MNAILLLAMASPNANAGLMPPTDLLDCKWNESTNKLDCRLRAKRPELDDDDDWGIQTAEAEGDSSMPTFILAVMRGESLGSIWVLQSAEKDELVYAELVVDVPADLKGWKAIEEDVNRDGALDLVVELSTERAELVWLGEFKDVVSWDKPDAIW